MSHSDENAEGAKSRAPARNEGMQMGLQAAFHSLVLQLGLGTLFARDKGLKLETP